MSANILFSVISTFILYVPSAKSEVSRGFNNCRHFFFKDTPPYLNNIANNKEICQMYLNVRAPQFATNYDTTNRIPSYSAYKVETFVGHGCRYNGWFIEPQLSDINDVPHMKRWDIHEEIKYKAAQAMDSDYKGTGYDRGHLNPSGYHCETNEARASTNTLTNVAPQVRTFNQGEWNKLERELFRISETDCNFGGAKRYFITGVIPSSGKFLNMTTLRVNIPDYYWTAVCCDSSNAIDLQDRNKGWSIGFLAENKDNTEIGIYSIENFLSSYRPKLFRDYIDPTGKTVKNCLFDPVRAETIINQIIVNLGGTTRITKHTGKTNGRPSYWQQTKNALYSAYEYVKNRIFG